MTKRVLRVSNKCMYGVSCCPWASHHVYHCKMIIILHVMIIIYCRKMFIQKAPEGVYTGL